jgi:hypothetical protein
MLKPSAPAMPGVTDTLEFVKNLWGSMQIPGAGLPGMPGMTGIAAPPMSTEDLDKRIADLKAVESWLNLNLSMLRGTIQALEVQRGTLMTLKTMGASMAEAMRQSGVSAEKMASMPFPSFFGAQGQGGNAAAKPAAGAPATKADAPKVPDAAAAGSGGTAQPCTATPPPAGAPDALGNAAAAAMPAAIAWWNMLQEQFTQAVASAMTPSAAASTATTASATPGNEGGGGAPKAEALKEAPKVQPAAPNGGNGSNGKAPRAPRTKTDRT